MIGSLTLEYRRLKFTTHEIEYDSGLLCLNVCCLNQE